MEYYHLDALGSVRVVTNETGAVVRRHDDLPFGQEWASTPGETSPKMFTRQERDVETGLDYFGARYYRTDIGRFTTTDPALNVNEALVDPQRWNRYVYVRNNPLRYVDPDGRWLFDVHGRLTDAALALAAGYGQSTAAAIANANVLTDTNPMTGPVNHPIYHFPPSYLAGALWRDFETSRSAAALGTYLHVLQDRYAHTMSPELHVIKGTDVDDIALHPSEAAAAAKATYSSLIIAAPLLRETLSGVPWAALEPLVLKYARCKDDQERDAVVSRIAAVVKSYETR